MAPRITTGASSAAAELTDGSNPAADPATGAAGQLSFTVTSPISSLLPKPPKTCWLDSTIALLLSPSLSAILYRASSMTVVYTQMDRMRREKLRERHLSLQNGAEIVMAPSQLTQCNTQASQLRSPQEAPAPPPPPPPPSPPLADTTAATTADSSDSLGDEWELISPSICLDPTAPTSSPILVSDTATADAVSPPCTSTPPTTPPTSPTPDNNQHPHVCVICLSAITSDVAGSSSVRTLPCGHPFHKRCIDTWLTGASSETSCYTNRCPTCNCTLAVSSSAVGASFDGWIDGGIDGGIDGADESAIILHSDAHSDAQIPAWTFHTIARNLASSGNDECCDSDDGGNESDRRGDDGGDDGGDSSSDESVGELPRNVIAAVTHWRNQELRPH
jgi:hypothetical protein